MPNTLRLVSPLAEKLAQYDSGNLIALQNLSKGIQPFLSLKLIGAGPASDSEQNAPVFTSGQALVTYVIAGQAAYEDSTGKRGLLKQGGLSWVLSGGGMWSCIEPVTTNYLAIELCVALAPALENSPPQSAWLDENAIERAGPASLFVGWFGEGRGNFTLPSLMNYALVQLRAQQEWSYPLPANHSVCWVFVVKGSLEADAGKIAANKITLLNCARGKTRLRATADAVFVVGSSQAFGHDLISLNNSVHTSPEALRLGMSRLAALEQSLV
jgi:redox-sensitive bicupin YhaK (pirin superfamily)